MVRTLTRVQQNKLFKFVGYGRLDAPVWFVGLEEGVDPSKAVERIEPRLTFRKVEDCLKASEKLDVMHYHHVDRPKIARYWGTCARVMLRLERRRVTKAHVRAYQRDELGRKSGQTLLTQLLPMPSPATSAWPYDELLGMTRAEYTARVLPQRVEMFRTLAKRHRPKLVVCYGKNRWSAFACAFPAKDFTLHDGFLVGALGRTTVVLAPHATRALRADTRQKDLVQVIREAGVFA